MKYYISLKVEMEAETQIVAKVADSFGIETEFVQSGVKSTRVVDYGLIYSHERNIERIKAVILKLIKDSSKKGERSRLDIRLSIYDDTYYKCHKVTVIWLNNSYNEIGYRLGNNSGSCACTKKDWLTELDRMIRQGLFIGEKLNYEGDEEDFKRDMDTEHFEEFLRTYWIF